MTLSCCVLQENNFPLPYNKPFPDQACLVKISSSFDFCVFMDLDFVLVHKHTKKELGQCPTILTSHLVNNLYLRLLHVSLEPLQLTPVSVPRLLLPQDGSVQCIPISGYCPPLCEVAQGINPLNLKCHYDEIFDIQFFTFSNTIGLS